MACCKLVMSLDTSRCEKALAALAEAAELLPEIRDALLGFLESGEEIFSIDCNGRPAVSTGEIVVGLYPSDGFLRFVSALRARNPDLRLFEHFVSSACSNSTTADELTQC